MTDIEIEIENLAQCFDSLRSMINRNSEMICILLKHKKDLDESFLRDIEEFNRNNQLTNHVTDRLNRIIADINHDT